MFYENERIIRKQMKFINQKATEMIDNFKSKDLNPDEITAALELLLEDPKGSETHREIVNRTIVILKHTKESDG